MSDHHSAPKIHKVSQHSRMRHDLVLREAWAGAVPVPHKLGQLQRVGSFVKYDGTMGLEGERKVSMSLA